MKNEPHIVNHLARERGADGKRCPCCGRDVPLTFHHLIPKKVHRRERFKKHFDKSALSGGVYLCRQCHSGIHKRYDEMTLARDYSSLEALLNDEALQKHFRWVSKQRRSR